MSVFLQKLIYNRYHKNLQVWCFVCYKSQFLQCITRPSFVHRAYSTSRIVRERSFLCISKIYSKDGQDLLEPAVSQHLCITSSRRRLLNSRQRYLQLRHCYSTKKNVAIPDEDPKVLPSKKDPVVEDKIKCIRVKESIVDETKKKLPVNEGSATSSIKLDDPASIITPETSLTDVNKKTIDTKIGNEKLLSRLQRYLLWRFTWYLKRFQQSLEHEMPDTFNMFRIFSIGLKDFVLDFKDFIKVLIIISMPGSTLRSLSRREIELYYNMPGDMLRVFPILVISSVPFGQNIAFPIGYWFPKHLLCHHFWDIKQRHDFALMGLKKRIFNARPVFRSMQAMLRTIESKEYQHKCQAVFYKLGSGIHPTTAEVIALLPLFQGHPFHIKSIRAIHVNGLLRLHGKSVLLRRRQGLYDHARMLHYLDTAISREGIESLTFDQLKASLFLRGVNPTNMSTKSMTDFLERWLTVSREIDASSYSLLLHLPILLAYNQPTNFVLIY